MSTYFDDSLSLDDLELAAGGCYHPNNEQPVNNGQLNNGNLTLNNAPIHNDWGGITGGFPLTGGLGGPVLDIVPTGGLNGVVPATVPAGFTGLPLIHGGGTYSALPANFAPQPVVDYHPLFRSFDIDRPR